MECECDSLCMTEKDIDFSPITLENLPKINHYLQYQNYRTCDFSLGGIFMWADYFNYEYLIYKDTLFIKGSSEIDASVVSFSLPIGKLSIDEAIGLLEKYCEQHSLRLVLSAVPEIAMRELTAKYSFRTEKLEDWSDYVYDARKLATLSGKAYNKKRNHVNRFEKDYPDTEYMRIDDSNLPEVLKFFYTFKALYNDKNNPVAVNELNMTEYLLKNYSSFHFTGALIKIDGKVVAFTVGEIIHDTLYVHIEKASREYSGIYETINMRFAADMVGSHPDVLYINREEDVGDEGLRKAKLSYNPIMILNKYNLYE